MGVYAYEGRLIKEDDGQGYTIVVPQFPGTAAGGDTIEEVCQEIAGCLQLVIAEYLDTEMVLPKPVFNDPPGVVICVEITDALIAESKCLTVGEAAKYLGVSPSRVCQLLSHGQLEEYRNGGQRMVTLASLNERIKNKPPAHRPKSQSQSF